MRGDFDDVTIDCVMHETSDDPRDLREQALERLKKRRDFQGHLVAYVVVNAALWAIWAATGASYPWPAWVTGAWGIGVLLNAWEVYMRAPITEEDVQSEMNRLARGT